MVIQQGKQRRSYATAGMYVNGANALDPAHMEEHVSMPRRRPSGNAVPRNYTRTKKRAKAMRKPLTISRLLLIPACGVFVAMCVIYAMQFGQYSQLKDDVGKAQSALMQQKESNVQLESQLSTMKDGERIRIYAVNKLSMVAPGKGEERAVAIIYPYVPEAPIEMAKEEKYTLLDILIDLL